MKLIDKIFNFITMLVFAVFVLYFIAAGLTNFTILWIYTFFYFMLGLAMTVLIRINSVHRDIKRLMNFLARESLSKFLTKLEDIVEEYKEVKTKPKKRSKK